MMQKSFENLFEAFSHALGESDAGHADVMESFARSMVVCQDYLVRLRAMFDASPPASEEEEVLFFKSIKPKFFAERIYRFERYQLLMGRPVGTVEMVRRFLESELAQVNRFFDAYQFPYLYFKSKGSELDGVYFVRSAKLPVAILRLELEPDPSYACGADYLFAKFLALERLRAEILSELSGLAVSSGALPYGPGPGAGEVPRKRLSWTGEVINLVELGYAVWLTGQLNAGKAGLQDIFNWLEESFGVEIGIPANRFREIRRRKRLSRTHFTELCQAKLTEYMDEDDIYHADGKKRKRGLRV